MATAREATQQSLRCNTWVLKVPIHCVGCKRQVKKLLQSIEGVYTTSIDSQKQQVTVTGSIDSEILVKKLSKTGKHAEVCAEKTAVNVKKNEKQSNLESCEKQDQTTTNIKEAKLNSNKTNNPEKKTPTKNTQEVSLAKKGSNSPGTAATGNAGTGGKMKKGKGQKGNSGGDVKGPLAISNGLPNANQARTQGPANQVNFSPTIQQLSTILPHQGPPTVHVLNYNAAYPSKPGLELTYQVPLSSSTCISSYSTTDKSENYHVQAATAFSSFEIFSDENPHGCSVM